jgi:hypothetical protein
VTDLLIDLLTDRLTDLLSNLLTDWLTEWQANWLTYWLTGWLTDLLTDWPTDWLIGWLTDWLSYWLTYWLSDLLTDRLTDWLTQWLTGWMAGWLTYLLTQWLTYWLTDLLTCLYVTTRPLYQSNMNWLYRAHKFFISWQLPQSPPLCNLLFHHNSTEPVVRCTVALFVDFPASAAVYRLLTVVQRVVMTQFEPLLAACERESMYSWQQSQLISLAVTFI